MVKYRLVRVEWYLYSAASWLQDRSASPFHMNYKRQWDPCSRPSISHILPQYSPYPTKVWASLPLCLLGVLGKTLDPMFP